jgi:Phytanoyl-CoA dioxygenase (PhyH)
MHRKNPLLSKRLERFGIAAAVASAVGRTGVRLTYRFYDHFAGNPESRRRFRADPPVLDAIQSDVVQRLTRDGLAVVPFARLFQEEGLWMKLSADTARFTAAMEQFVQARRVGKGAKAPRNKKSYLLRRYTQGVELALDDPWFALGVSTRILDIVNTYLEMFAKFVDIDQWYTIPVAPEAARIASQRWHRDFDDRHLVKVFIYLSDVDAGAGPFEYIPGSTISGRYVRLWPWGPLSETYPPAEEFARLVPSQAAVSVQGPAGTMIFCNTSGFHRGGFATQKTRLMAIYRYASVASLKALTLRNFCLADPERLNDLPAAVRYALT